MSNILIAEDDAATCRFLEGALKSAGHTVRACEDGLEAWNILQKSGAAYDLLLTDIVMPGMDGIELSTRAAAVYPKLKIVFITGYAAMALQDGGAPASTNAKVIAKPFHLGRLVSEVEDMLAEKKGA
ncbi:MAG: response regulator [Micavibrio aeruginosavorus]|uniref:Response regulator n=1 Tax=Micavibrio aeruginosavorus TaxID=349221 RepID=A0A2W5N2S6_9BACT|nr:MAG: response regulator [Micavibrio aeruginosavorus]